MKFKEYLTTESKSISQQAVFSKFKFLPPEIGKKIAMDVWHYIDTKPGEKVISGHKTFTDELIARLNLDEWADEHLAANAEKKIISAIKSLNLDKDWEYDPKKKAFIRR